MQTALTALPLLSIDTRLVDIQVSDATLRLALCFLVEGAGYTRRADPLARTVVDLSRLTRDYVHDVVVVQPRPAECRRVVDLVAEGRVRSVVGATAPEDLIAALAGLDRGLVTVPRRIIEQGNLAPELRPRQLLTLQLVVAGFPNARIATATNASLSTVKRDIAELLERFDVANRTTLASMATQLGYVASPLRSASGRRQ